MFAVTVSRNLSIVSCCIFIIANTGGRTFVGTGQQFFRNSVSYTIQTGLPGMNVKIQIKLSFPGLPLFLGFHCSCSESLEWSWVCILNSRGDRKGAKHRTLLNDVPAIAGDIPGTLNLLPCKYCLPYKPNN